VVGGRQDKQRRAREGGCKGGREELKTVEIRRRRRRYVEDKEGGRRRTKETKTVREEVDDNYDADDNR